MDIAELELIRAAYLRVLNGAKRIDLETEEGISVKAYRVGTIIRIDIKGVSNENIC